MRIIKTQEDINNVIERKNNKIGLIPTMGALHDGHFSLIKKAKKYCNITVVSIFVNPLQFNNKNDFQKYPRTIDEDLKKLTPFAVDYVYIPTEETMNIDNSDTSIDFGYLEHIWEGKHRPGHFRGVGIIVTQLFNQIKPNYAFFGLKDYQQYLLVKTLAQKLEYPVKIIGMPTIRNNQGIALSSRNKRLNSAGLHALRFIYAGLHSAKNSILSAPTKPTAMKIKTIIKTQMETIEKGNSITIEYFECVNKNTMKPFNDQDILTDGILIIATYIDNVRLIDNMFLVESDCNTF